MTSKNFYPKNNVGNAKTSFSIDIETRKVQVILGWRNQRLDKVSTNLNRKERLTKVNRRLSRFNKSEEKEVSDKSLIENGFQTIPSSRIVRPPLRFTPNRGELDKILSVGMSFFLSFRFSFFPSFFWSCTKWVGVYYRTHQDIL